MLLLDSLYINNGGGKVLLDYLVERLEQSNREVFYLFDERCKKEFQQIPKTRKLFLKASLWNRYWFYRKHRGLFSKIFCFGNIPPLTKQKCQVITYFHQLLYLKNPFNIYIKENTSLKRFFSLLFRQLFLKSLSGNSNKWFVQLPSLKIELSDKYEININNVDLMPFYPSIPKDGNSYERIQNAYLYVSGGSPHKNHQLLINAFCRFYDKKKEGKLTLTIPDNFSDLCDLIKEKQDKGYPINNIGFVKRENLYKSYQTHEYLIYPSLAESFGLGIVEAIEHGCKVIGADLKYMHDVCIPSLIFNPYKEDELIKVFERSLDKDVKTTHLNIKNRINEVLKLLS
ncbi:glycosyltransferase [Massilibacteroides sp.]|uniref:glycosyltransferase n=1 Tax=Massilibacteroides sp. TaxID=2034766 RepID=UPI002605792E|nr:glycosyltransferase [Massilibacteroides sp.]MDD4515970.1 glycosyltransferase [Massilibacteroides sp.]